jgi:hypothetical protein
MLACFFDHKGIVHYEFIAQGQTLSEQCYRNLFGGKDQNSGLTSGFSTMTVPCAWCVKSSRVPG